MFFRPILQKSRLIFYYNKFKTPKLNWINIVYMLKCVLKDFVSKENNTYVALTTTTLLRRITMHLGSVLVV